MFLKSVELYGFKSFADRTKFEFKDGITSLLGPNGSGKSNVVDSIKWVLGSQGLKDIRAGKREDVIFNGTDFRKPMPMCEVILTLDNEQNLLNIDATEVEIKRRMFRNGENEFYINRNRVLLREVKELFMDTGVGKSAYSILEQGKIDQVISLKPEDRRYIFEEAAGISKFKQQSEEAQRKLEKTDENLAQVSIILHEAEKTYNSRKVQLDKVLKSRELNARKEELEVNAQLSYIKSLKEITSKFQSQKDEAVQELEEIEQYLNEKRSDMESQTQNLESLKERREQINIRINRTDEQKNSINREIDMYNERYQDIHRRTREAQFKAQQVQDRLEKDRQNFETKKCDLDNLRESIVSIQSSIVKTSEEIEQIKESRQSFGNTIVSVNQETENLSELRIEITNQISELANTIADRLEENIKGSAYSTAVRTKSEKAFFEELNKAKTILKERIDFLKGLSEVGFEKNVYLSAIEDADESLRTELDEIKGLFQEYSGTIPTFLDEFLSPEGTLAKKSSLDSQLEQTYNKENENKARVVELNREIDRLSNLLLLKDSDLKELQIEETQFMTKADSLKIQLQELEETLKQSEFDYSDASHSIEEELSKENEILAAIEEVKQRQDEAKAIIEELRNSVIEINAEIDNVTNEITERNKEFQDKYERKNTLNNDISVCNANIANFDVQIKKVYTDFFEDTGKSLYEFEGKAVDCTAESLKEELEVVKKKIADLGYINYMAEEEFNEAKKNFEFYSKNFDDITKSKNDLEEVIRQIKQKSEEMFLETYKQISEAFKEMFTTLFGGGRAELTLSDEENVLESGIEILAQPPGKKLTHLPLLSGGEKSMTAVALLFATYKVKPSPFCILDEIDAALDARNIGSFMSVLKLFGDKSQFIIITHNKNTVLGSNCLLGVTQQELGVSKMIGYKIDENEDLDNSEDTLKG